MSGTLDETLYCLRDYLDPVAVVDGLAVVQERYGYDAFGKARIMDPNFATISGSSFAWNWLFHGEFQDPETLLYNYGYRYYHPPMGRWISNDPLGEEGGANLYEFAGNSPLNKLDLLGLEPAGASSEDDYSWSPYENNASWGGPGRGLTRDGEWEPKTEWDWCALRFLDVEKTRL